MKRILLVACLATLCSAALAQVPYARRGDGQQWLNAYGECWRTGTWTPAQAEEPCDGARKAAAPAPAPLARVAPPPPPPPAPVQAAPAPQPRPAPVARAPEKISLSADVLFEFNSARLSAAGLRTLDELGARVADAENILIVGHADRLGSEKYNQKISEARAEAVKAQLQKSAKAQNIRTAGKGESEPVTGGKCTGLKPDSGKNPKLVQCLQPDRRVDIELSGVRSASR